MNDRGSFSGCNQCGSAYMPHKWVVGVQICNVGFVSSAALTAVAVNPVMMNPSFRCHCFCLSATSLCIFVGDSDISATRSRTAWLADMQGHVASRLWASNCGGILCSGRGSVA